MITSQPINDLCAAIAKAQGKIGAAHKSSDNPFYKSKYADLASVWDACREPLAENGLAIVQTWSIKEYVPCEYQNDKGQVVKDHFARVSLTTRLVHASGQFIEDTSEAESRDAGPQAIGSVVTYLRRYALQAMVGVAPDDDDGNAGQRPERKPTGERTVAAANGHRPAGTSHFVGPTKQEKSEWESFKDSWLRPAVESNKDKFPGGLKSAYEILAPVFAKYQLSKDNIRTDFTRAHADEMADMINAKIEEKSELQREAEIVF